MHIFRDNAPLYWQANIPVIPLKRWNSPGKGAGKAPILSEWTQYGDVMPSEAMRQHWLGTYPDSNIGLPFGPASGLCAIDIDTEDPDMVEAIKAALPFSPWVRIGKKGMGLIFKWQGQPNFKLRNSENESIVEFLGKGNQMVLPPSIHPDTGKPYNSNTNLWEVLDKILAIPIDIEQRLRDALGLHGVSLAQSGRSGPLDVVPQGERDIQLVRQAGYLARVVRGIDKRANFSLLEAMQQMHHWVENFTAHSSGDNMDPDKGVAKLLEFLLKDVEAGHVLPKGWDVGLTDEHRKDPAIAAMIEKNKIQKWEYSKAKEWMLRNIEQDPENADYVMDVIMELIQEVAKDETFTDFNFNTLIADIQSAGRKIGLTLSKTDLRNTFKTARSGEREQAEDHEAVARIIVDQLNREGELRWDQGKFWQWNGSCFAEVADKEIYMAVATRIKGNPIVRRHYDYAAIAKTITHMVTEPLAQELEEGINFANGFLDIDLQLHDHSPKYGKTFTMPFEYIPARAGEAHKWLEYLERTWGDDEDYAEKVMALQEAFAATMFGVAPKHQRAFLLHGKARTGKTTALEVLQAMMPPAAKCVVPPQMWAARFQLSAMIGKALNVCGELPEATIISGDKFKEVVEGAIQGTEFKGKDIIHFRPFAAHWFASNFLPRSRDSSEGFTRRWLIFDFNRQVPDEEKVVDFWKVLVAEEREAIAAWAVQGLRRLQEQNGYTLPLSHHKRITQVTRMNNSVAAFLQSSDKMRPSTNYEDTADVRNMYDSYVYYTREVVKGWHVTYEMFMQMLQELGHPCEEYTDGVGVKRHQAHNIRVIGLQLPKKDVA